MRYWILTLLLLSTPCLAEQQILNAEDLTHEQYQEIVERNAPGPIVRFPAGYHCPLQLAVRGDILHLVGEGGGTLVLQQPLYVQYMGDGNFLFSQDGMGWRTLLEFVTGNIAASVSVDEQDEPKAIVDITANVRE